MRKDQLRTLFTRMIATYLTVTLSLVVVLGVTVVALLHSQALRENKLTLQQETAAVVDLQTERLMEQISYPEFKQELSVIARRDDALIEILNVSGGSEQYYDAQKWSAFAGRSVYREELDALIKAASTGKYTSVDYFAENTEMSTLSRFALITDHGVATHVVLMHQDMTQTHSWLRGIALEVLLIILAGLLIAVVSVYYTTNALTRPFRQVNEIVQRYSKGDYNARIPISDTEEATQLALSFNTMADQLMDLEATRRSFVANVSHELRSPLTSMRGFLEAMQDGTIGREDYDQYIDIVLSETRRMTSMVNDLLDLARIESGKTAIKLEVFDINELIRRTLITFEARIYEQRMDVDIKFAQEQCYVEADSAQISQVLRNLIDNAIKYSPENSKLRIASYALRREVFVSIQDFGHGIPEEDVPHVFDRFYKVEKAHTPTKQSGTGLGLSIVKRIIDQHGQRITVKSIKGKGSTFTFTLKRAPSPKRQQQDGGRETE